jgi:hypothetical protein
MYRESEADDTKDESFRDAPTLPPPAAVSVVRYKVGVSVDELLYRFSMGDMAGAVDSALELLDEDPIPIVAVPTDVLSEMVLGHHASYVLSFIDCEATLDEVIKASGLPLVEALRALCELLDQSVIALR